MVIKSKPTTIKLRVKPTIIKLDSKDKSKVKPKSKSTSPQKKNDKMKSKSNLIKNSLIATAITIGTPLSGFLIKEAYEQYKNNYGLYGFGYKKEKSQYNKEHKDIERALGSPISFKNYMENAYYDYNYNYKQDQDIIKKYNDKNPNNEIKSLFEYIKYGKQKINVDPIRPYNKEYYRR